MFTIHHILLLLIEVFLVLELLSSNGRTTDFHFVNLGSIPNKSNMFKNIFEYWSFNTNNNVFNSKINMWGFVNSQNFKFKLSSYITIIVNSLNCLAIKKIKILYKTLHTSYIIIKLIVVLTILSFLLLVF